MHGCKRLKDFRLKDFRPLDVVVVAEAGFCGCDDFGGGLALEGDGIGGVKSHVIADECKGFFALCQDQEVVAGFFKVCGYWNGAVKITGVDEKLFVGDEHGVVDAIARVGGFDGLLVPALGRANVVTGAVISSGGKDYRGVADGAVGWYFKRVFGDVGFHF